MLVCCRLGSTRLAGWPPLGKFEGFPDDALSPFPRDTEAGPGLCDDADGAFS